MTRSGSRKGFILVQRYKFTKLSFCQLFSTAANHGLYTDDLLDSLRLFIYVTFEPYSVLDGRTVTNMEVLQRAQMTSLEAMVIKVSVEVV